MRATSATMYCEQGQVWFPEWAPWLADFESELLQFTADDSHAHDDQVDILAYAVRQIARTEIVSTERPFTGPGAFG